MARHGAFELAVPVSAVDHLTGSAHAPVTVVEYGDFECPNCKQAQSALKLLLERFDGRARLAFRNFPLEDVHPHALAAAEAAECAGGQGKFWPSRAASRAACVARRPSSSTAGSRTSRSA